MRALRRFLARPRGAAAGQLIFDALVIAWAFGFVVGAAVVAVWGGRLTAPLKVHGYVEITVAAALLQEDGTFLNGDMADVTLAFGIPTMQPPRPLTEPESQESIRVNLGKVAAIIEAVLIANGVEHLGQVEEPMTNAEGGRVVGYRRTEAVRVVLHPIEEARA